MPHSSRPKAMLIDAARGTDCELCSIISPFIRHDPMSIPVTAESLEAMAQCPTGAIVWRERSGDRAPLDGGR